MTQPCRELLSQALDTYLKKSKKSLSSLASELSMSKSHLSDIKNGKARPGIDLGLKILKNCGIDLESRRRWLDRYMMAEIPEYQELQQSVVNQTEGLRLPQDIGELLENNLDLMHLVLDIIEEKDFGLAESEIEVRYGTRGKRLVTYLVESNVAQYRHGRYYAEDKRLVMSKKSSYSFLESVFRDQRERHLRGTYEGRFEFQVDDVSDAIMQELFVLHQEYMRRLAETIKKARHMDKRKKGKRVIVQALTCVLRNNLSTVLIVVLGFGYYFQRLALASDGGLGGGNNSSRFYTLKVPGYRGESEAIEAGAKIEELISQNNYAPLERIGKLECEEGLGHHVFERAQVNRYEIGRYFSKREEFFDLKLSLQISCKELKASGWNGK